MQVDAVVAAEVLLKYPTAQPMHSAIVVAPKVPEYVPIIDRELELVHNFNTCNDRHTCRTACAKRFITVITAVTALQQTCVPLLRTISNKINSSRRRTTTTTAKNTYLRKQTQNRALAAVRYHAAGFPQPYTCSRNATDVPKFSPAPIVG